MVLKPFFPTNTRSAVVSKERIAGWFAVNSKHGLFKKVLAGIRGGVMPCERVGAGGTCRFQTGAGKETHCRFVIRNAISIHIFFLLSSTVTAKKVQQKNRRNSSRLSGIRHAGPLRECRTSHRCHIAGAGHHIRHVKRDMGQHIDRDLRPFRRTNRGNGKNRAQPVQQ